MPAPSTAPFDTTSDSHSAPIYPVILKVPEAIQPLSGHAKVDALQRLAREALAFSGRKSGWPVFRLKKDGKGAPIPENGIYWSLSHKSRFVAAVTAPYPVGIDIEKIRPVNEALKHRIASRKEWRLDSGTESNFLFFRFWTAKEAVLKAVGVGLTGLSKCRATEIIDEQRLCLTYGKTVFRVAQSRYMDHLVAVIIDHRPIYWTYLSKLI